MAADAPETPASEEEIVITPITPEIQKALYDIIDTLIPEKKDHTLPENQMSQLLIMFRDGELLDLSALTKSASGQMEPIAKNYPLPIDLGQIRTSTAITAIACKTPGGAIAASYWFPRNGKHVCVSG